MSLQEIKALFARFDKDGNGTISFDEFLENLRVRQTLHSISHSVAALNNFTCGRILCLYLMCYERFKFLLYNSSITLFTFTWEMVPGSPSLFVCVCVCACA